MQPNLASVMPQVIGVWCEEAGHDVRFLCYTGGEDLTRELPRDADVLFIAAHTQSAQLAYSLSNLYRRQGVVTVLGGPHARCYPQRRGALLRLRARLHRQGAGHGGPAGLRARTIPGCSLTAKRQPTHLPGIAAALEVHRAHDRQGRPS